LTSPGDRSPPSLRVLLVDDEPLALELLRDLLARHPDVVIAGEARDGAQAAHRLNTETFDAVFLDVQMPELDGFEVLRSVAPERLPQVVFVTAFDRHAVRAFEVAAIDFLLKPYDQERLNLALDRVRQRLAEETRPRAEDQHRLLAFLNQLDQLDQLDQRRSFPDRLFLREGERTVVLPVAEIRWLEARGKKVSIHGNRRTVEVRDTLKRFEEEDLDPQHFLRVSRSAIVHVAHIAEIQPWFRGELVLLLKDGTQVSTTRGYRDRVTGLLGK